MRDDIVPPKKDTATRSVPGEDVPKPVGAPDTATTELPVAREPSVASFSDPQPIESDSSKKGRSIRGFISRKPWLAAAIGLALIVLICGIVVTLWYGQQLTATDPGSSEKVKITIDKGESLVGIANELKTSGLIKSESAFGLYVRIKGSASKLQSGSYRLSKADDVPAIVKHLTSGATDTFSITFLPGATLAKHRQVLLNAGYTVEDVDAALKQTYDGPLFAGKPAGTDLEGYIYGETYSFPADATPSDILRRTFKEFEQVAAKEKLAQSYAQRGFTMYQGITLASVIQREVATPADAAQVAQVFELRLKNDMPLGSDVTYQYIADKTGQARSVDIDSPYNTRRYKGLPPGPISSPGISALKAVGYPAAGDYVYFLSGDDDKTYFARTNEEHEKNIREHCQKKCQII